MSSASAAVHPDPEVPLKSEETKVPTSQNIDPDLAPKSNTHLTGPKIPKMADPKRVVLKSDETIQRLAKLIKNTSGLGALLSSLSYALYIAAYLDINSPTRARIIEYVSRLVGRIPSKVAPGALKPVVSVSRFAPYIALINDARFTIRLTGLIPLYVALKGLLKNPPKDEYLRLLAQVQVASYIAFQAIENAWFLGTKGLLSPTTLNRLGGSQNLLVWSCRPWLVAIICDFLRLAREAQIYKEDNSENKLTYAEKQKASQKWYGELFGACSYLPMAVHYSLNGGIGMNTGMIGLSGVLGGSGNLTKMWAATKD